MKVVFRPLCGFIRSQSQLVYNKDISQYSCLCEICENAVFTFKSLWRNEQVLPNNPNYLVQQFSCNSGSRTCMYDYICAVCESLLLNLRDFGFSKWTSNQQWQKVDNKEQKKIPNVPPNHWMKSVQIQSFPWSVYSRIQSECGKIRTRKNSVFGHFSCSEWIGSNV